MENEDVEKLFRETFAKHQKKIVTETKTCKICGQLKKRILDGTFDGRNKRWKDSEGRLWNGHTCGECHMYKMRQQMRNKRNEPS